MALEKNKEELLNHLYYSFESPAAFSSLRNLYKLSKSYNPNISFKFVEKWLTKQQAYVYHKRKRKQFPRRKTITSGINDLHQMDLMDVSKLAYHNSGVRYLLVIIDCFSRFAQVRPLKRKFGTNIADALENLYKYDKRIPNMAQFDRGTEFYNVSVKSVFRRYNVRWYSTDSKLKASLIERFIRSLRELIAKALYKQENQKKYIDILPKLIKIYNNRKHRSIGMTPAEVNSNNEEQLWKKQYGNEFPNIASNFKFEIGQKVKIARIKSLFEKEWTRTWSDEDYYIIFRRSTKPVTYKLTDEKHNLVSGSYYEPELQAV